MKPTKIIKKGAAFALATAMIFTGTTAFSGGINVAKASETDFGNVKATVPKAVLADALKPYNVNPGDTVNVTIPVKASNYVIRKPIINVDLSKTGGFELASDVVCTDSKGNKMENISVGDTAYIKFSVRIPLNAKKGRYNDIPVTFITTDSFNDYQEVTLEQSSKLTFVVDSQKKNAKLSLLDSEYPRTVKDNDDVDVKLTFHNDGELAADNVTVSISGYESTLIPNDQPTANIGTIKGGEDGSVDFDFDAISNLAAGVTKLDVTVKYDNSDGTSADPQTFTLSMQTIAKKTEAEKLEIRPVLQVSNVNYPHYRVNVGDSFDVVYEFKNIGKVDAKNIVVDTTGYSEAGFKPAQAYDKFRLASLKAGGVFRIRRSFTATETVTDGMKPITVNYSYYSVKDKTLATQLTDTMSIYIDAKGKEESGEVDNSMPRLTVSKYSTGKDKIKAGKEFTFTFDVKNPHPSASADNIVVTISSADNSFSIVEGSASMFINSLKAGQSEKLSIPLKAKGDIATNGYDLTITFDYEYLTKDVANKNALIKKQNKIEEKLKLQVYSDDRPMVANISVGAGDTPVLNESTSLSFDFNNMGKAILYNVTAKVKGDFKSANEVLIIGNVNAGEGRSWSMDVTPQVDGMGKGVLTISYEDSNGNVSSYDTDFESMVNATNPEDVPDTPINPMPIDEGPKDIIPLWAFICGNIVLFLIGALVVKGIAVKKYKKKKLAEAMREDEEL